MRLLTAIMLSIVGALGAAAPAGAGAGRVVATPTHEPVTPPVLAGDRGLAWLERPGTELLELWVWSPRDGARRVQRIVMAPPGQLPSFGLFVGQSLSASSTSLGLELITSYKPGRPPGQTDRVQTFAGGFGERLSDVNVCEQAGGLTYRVRSIDLQDATVAFRGPTCNEATVRDMTAGPASDRRIGPNVFATRLADPFEAWLEFAGSGAEPGAAPSGISDPATGGVTAVVRDRRTGAELTRAGLDTVPQDISLRADGTLALRDEARLAVIDPGAAAARPLALSVLPAPIRWIGAQLGVVSPDRPGSTDGLLALIDAEGRETRRIAELDGDAQLAPLTDLNATHAAWVTRGCRSAQIRLIALSAAETITRTPDHCALRLAQRPTLRGRRLRVGVSCAGFRPDCAARITVRSGRLVVARGGSVARDQTAPHVARADLVIRPAARALVGGRRRLRVRISAEYSTTFDASTPGEVTRRTTATLRP